MKTKIYITQYLILSLSLSLISCEDYLEVETPDYKISTETVFNSDETARSAMQGIYNQLMNSTFSGGSAGSVTVLSGLSAHELEATRVNDQAKAEFEQNEILPTNPLNLELWESAYNMIYLANALLEGLENSDHVSSEINTRLAGEAKFIRAFSYFYLVNLYGDVPLVLTTDYRQNELAQRDPQQEVYQQIIDDLNASIGLLGVEYSEGERTRVNKYAAMALLARFYLYLEDWQLAEDLSSQVIAQNSLYEILDDLDEVFLANSQEAIWQISPAGGGDCTTRTNEGYTFIFHPVFAFLTSVQLSGNLVSSFESEDKRLHEWIGYLQGRGYYAFKYKERSSTDKITEYSMVLRLSEQYLIRSEARAMQNNLAGAISDLDIIRQRAGLDSIADTNPQISKEDLLGAILEERKKELYTEWGHRWLDLKRTGKAAEVLSSETSFWEDTDVLYPIPAEERIKNPNLTQNRGY